MTEVPFVQQRLAEASADGKFGEVPSRVAVIRKLIGRVRWAAAGITAPVLLGFLLAVDVAFILVHLLHTYSPLLPDAAFSLAKDRGFAELFQYLKLSGLVAMFAARVRARRAPLDFHWMILFTFVLLDDALLIHERLGESLATAWSLPDLLGARGYHLGEFLIFGLAGLIFATSLTITYPRSDRRTRAQTQDLVLLIGGLAAFGVVLDLVQELVLAGWLRDLIALAEDGGENILVSVIAWAVLVKTREDLSWGSRPFMWLRTAAAGGALFAVMGLFLWSVQSAAPGLAGNDGYYHARLGWLVRQQGLKPTPPKLPFTILNEGSFYDHHLLYHGYLALFAGLDPAEDGGLSLTRSTKVASVILPALAFLAVWWLLRRQGIRGPAWWTLGLLALSGVFLYRMSMPRAQAASLLFLVLAIHGLLSGQYRGLIPLGFAYVWLFDGFPLLIVVAVTYFAAAWIVDRRAEWRALAYPLLGILLGLVVNPYFPQNLAFIGQHLLPKLAGIDIPVGNEWYPYAFPDLIRHAGGAIGIWILGLVVAVWQRRAMDKRTLALLLLSVVFGLMMVRARRFIEYFPPFALIFAAFSLQVALDRLDPMRLPRRRVLLVGLALLTALPLFFSLRAARASMARALPAEQFAAAALWLRAYAEPDARVFQIDWDDFPRLYFYDERKEYTVGLDPTFMSLYDPHLYEEWVAITRGEISFPGEAIRSRFEADYVFSDGVHEEFLAQADEDPNLQRIYRDDYAIIFKVVE